MILLQNYESSFNLKLLLHSTRPRKNRPVKQIPSFCRAYKRRSRVRPAPSFVTWEVTCREVAYLQGMQEALEVRLHVMCPPDMIVAATIGGRRQNRAVGGHNSSGYQASREGVGRL